MRHARVEVYEVPGGWTWSLTITVLGEYQDRANVVGIRGGTVPDTGADPRDTIWACLIEAANTLSVEDMST